MHLSFCGVDGVGKTTAMKAVAREMLNQGITNFVLTKEPGGPASLWEEWDKPLDLEPYFGEHYPTGLQVRELCVNHPDIPQLAKRALYKADNLCNWIKITKPAIAANKLVLSDRGWISDLVYGTVLCNIDVHSLYQFNTALVPELPDLTYVIHFTCSTEERERRLSTNVADAMDKLGSEVRDKLAESYHIVLRQTLAESHYLEVSTEQDMGDIVAQSLGFIKSLL